jgi:ribose/xylose/arabinose/galactoside ABC-type transport system permease subunit
MSSDVTQVPRQSPTFSSLGRATFNIAARVGGLFAAVIVVAVIFLLINPNFANPNLAVSILRTMSSVAIMAIGLTLVIVVGEIDLSFGAMYGLAANSLAVMWVVHGIPVYLAIPLTLAIAAFS